MSEKIGIISYRNNKRMKDAYNLPECNPVSIVAKQLGRETQFSLSRAFKSHFGTSPTEAKEIFTHK